MMHACYFCVYLCKFQCRLDVSSGNTGEEDSAFSDSVEDEAENIENIAGKSKFERGRAPEVPLPYQICPPTLVKVTIA